MPVEVGGEFMHDMDFLDAIVSSETLTHYHGELCIPR